METLTMEDLKDLTIEHEPPCVSIYMPTSRGGVDGGNDIKFKNMLKRAEELLSGAGHKERPIKALLAPAWHLHEDKIFWEYQADGFACFIAKDVFRYYRLPLAFPEIVTANSRFHLKPLLEILGPAGRFYVLALSKNQVRAYYCTRNGARLLRVPDLPDSLKYTLRFDEFESNMYQEMTPSPGGRPGGGRTQATFHGHGTETDRAQKDVLRYFHEIDNALHKILRAEQAPLVLACVDYMAGLYRRASKYLHITDETISGNADAMSGAELHAAAWKVVEPIFLQCRRQAFGRYEQAAANRQATTEVPEAVLASQAGLIEVLFTAVGDQVWGTFDPVTRHVEVHDSQEPEDQDLLNLIAVQVLQTGGAIWAVEANDMPTKSPVAAVMRYPVPAQVLQES